MSSTVPTGSYPRGYTTQGCTPQDDGSNFGRVPQSSGRPKPTARSVATFGAAGLALVGMVAAVSLSFAGPATIVDGGGHSHHAGHVGG